MSASSQTTGCAYQRVVLIADDEPSHRRLIRLTLGSDDYQVIEAINGDEAWQLARSHQPRVILLDVRMPGRCALDITRSIKTDPGRAMTCIILLSAQSKESDVTAGLDAGADFYLTKPFSPIRLIQVVEEALGVDEDKASGGLSSPYNLHRP